MQSRPYDHLNSSTLAPLPRGEEEFDNQYTDLAHYGKARFWDHRYSVDPEPFEWYYGYDVFKTYIVNNIPKDDSVLVAGCGSSHLLEDMVNDGYEKISGLDISRVVISQLKKRCEDYPEIQLLQGNICDSGLPDGSYSAIIDKALFDAVICSSSGDKGIYTLIYEIDRLLTDEGVYICISHGNPEDRLKYLEHYDLDEQLYTPWYISVQATQIPLEFDGEELDEDSPDSLYFIYICRKDPVLVAKKKKREIKVEKIKETKKKTRKGAFPL